MHQLALVIFTFNPNITHLQPLSKTTCEKGKLGGFWKDLFGYPHGIAIISAFFDNVSQHNDEGRELAPGETEKNVILEFRPQPAQDMLVACLWSEWEQDGERLLSFAAITDDPPPEVAAAGYDRCIIPIRAENVDAWLNPNPRDLAAQRAILDDRPAHTATGPSVGSGHGCRDRCRHCLINPRDGGVC